MLKNYQVTTVHTAGQSTDHYCRKSQGALLSDPVCIVGEQTEMLASSADIAEEIVRSELRELAKDCSCGCGKCDMAGSEDWWESVSVVAREVVRIKFFGGLIGKDDLFQEHQVEVEIHDDESACEKLDEEYDVAQILEVYDFNMKAWRSPKEMKV